MATNACNRGSVFKYIKVYIWRETVFCHLESVELIVLYMAYSVLFTLSNLNVLLLIVLTKNRIYLQFRIKLCRRLDSTDVYCSSAWSVFVRVCFFLHFLKLSNGHFGNVLTARARLACHCSACIYNCIRFRRIIV